MVREFLGNLKGPKGDVGEKGAKGDKGDTGEVSDINANIIPMSLNDWVLDETYNTVTGEVVSFNGRSRLNRKIPVRKGDVYTLSDESTYISALGSIRWFIYDNGTFIESDTINRGEQKQITMTGNEITFTLNPIDNFSNPAKYIEYDNHILSFKLERGSVKTKHLNVLKHYDRKISKHDREINDLKNVNQKTTMMIARAYQELVGGTATPLRYYGIQHDNLVNPDNSDEIVLSAGIWSLDWMFNMRNHTDGEQCLTTVRINDEPIVYARHEGNVYNSISTKIIANEGDKLKLTQNVDEGSEFEINNASNPNNRMVLYKIGGL